VENGHFDPILQTISHDMETFAHVKHHFDLFVILLRKIKVGASGRRPATA
jgi:hypothetical protein